MHSWLKQGQQSGDIHQSIANKHNIACGVDMVQWAGRSGSLTLNGRRASACPSGDLTAAGSNLTENSSLSKSGAPGSDRTLSPRSTENPVPYAIRKQGEYT